LSDSLDLPPFLRWQPLGSFFREFASPVSRKVNQVRSNNRTKEKVFTNSAPPNQPIPRSSIKLRLLVDAHLAFAQRHSGCTPGSPLRVRRVLIANRYESFEPWLRSPPPSRISSPAAPLGTGEVAGKPLSRRPPRASGHQHHFFSLQTVHIFYRLSGLPDMRPMAAGLLKKQRGFREGTVSSGAPSFRSNTKVH
jgi:hypothetical protein